MDETGDRLAGHLRRANGLQGGQRPQPANMFVHLPDDDGLFLLCRLRGRKRELECFSRVLECCSLDFFSVFKAVDEIFAFQVIRVLCACGKFSRRAVLSIHGHLRFLRSFLDVFSRPEHPFYRAFFAENSESCGKRKRTSEAPASMAVADVPPANSMHELMW